MPNLTEPLVLAQGQIQRAGQDDVVRSFRYGWSSPDPLLVTGDFTMTQTVHELFTIGPGTVNVNNINGAETGELLFLFGNRVRLRNNTGNLAGLANSFRLRPGRTILLYFANPLWLTVSEAR